MPREERDRALEGLGRDGDLEGPCERRRGRRDVVEQDAAKPGGAEGVGQHEACRNEGAGEPEQPARKRRHAVGGPPAQSSLEPGREHPPGEGGVRDEIAPPEPARLLE